MVLWGYGIALGLTLPSTFIFEPIFMKFTISADIKKAQFHYFKKYGLKGN